MFLLLKDCMHLILGERMLLGQAESNDMFAEAVGLIIKVAIKDSELRPRLQGKSMRRKIELILSGGRVKMRNEK